MKLQPTLKHLSFIVLFLMYISVFSQNPKQEEMEQLNFMVGEWVGTSTIYENGVVSKECAASENISYALDTHILVIDLNTEFLQLHTIIVYDVEDQHYYYHRFSKNGEAVYPGEFKDGQLIVWRDEKTRFFFCETPEGGFKEYGEQLIEGKWIKIFEDSFTTKR